jgi:hypothetical protein
VVWCAVDSNAVIWTELFDSIGIALLLTSSALITIPSISQAYQSDSISGLFQSFRAEIIDHSSPSAL